MRKIFIIFLFLIFFIPSVSLAAEIFFNVDKSSFGENEEFLVEVFLDTKDDTVNAGSGSIIFPSDLLELKEIRDGNSVINFWVEKIHIDTVGKVSFSGITTGGFSGSKRFLFGLVFQSRKEGNSSIIFNNIQILQNDGLGTKISTQGRPFIFSILKELNGSIQDDLKVIDIDPPEDFNPLIGNDESLFSGKYFIAFSTVDKGVGMDHYEIREGFLDDYVVAESPYLLKDQSLEKDIFIKAIDHSHNERLVRVKARNSNIWLELGLIFVILLSICIFVFKKIRSKYSQQ